MKEMLVCGSTRYSSQNSANKHSQLIYNEFDLIHLKFDNILAHE